jgi:hypothetical protein
MHATTDTQAVTGHDERDPGVDRGPRQDFVYDVDGTTYHHDRPKITGAEIMLAAGIPSSDGLVQLLQDGSTATVNPDDEVHLVPGALFKRRPKFKRG